MKSRKNRGKSKVGRNANLNLRIPLKFSSHTMTLLSSDPDASSFAFDEKSQHTTVLECSFKQLSRVPSMVLNTYTRLPPTVATFEPSALMLKSQRLDEV